MGWLSDRRFDRQVKQQADAFHAAYSRIVRLNWPTDPRARTPAWVFEMHHDAWIGAINGSGMRSAPGSLSEVGVEKLREFAGQVGVPWAAVEALIPAPLTDEQAAAVHAAAARRKAERFFRWLKANPDMRQGAGSDVHIRKVLGPYPDLLLQIEQLDGDPG